MSVLYSVAVFFTERAVSLLSMLPLMCSVRTISKTWLYLLPTESQSNTTFCILENTNSTSLFLCLSSLPLFFSLPLPLSLSLSLSPSLSLSLPLFLSPPPLSLHPSSPSHSVYMCTCIPLCFLLPHTALIKDNYFGGVWFLFSRKSPLSDENNFVDFVVVHVTMVHKVSLCSL